MKIYKHFWWNSRKKLLFKKKQNGRREKLTFVEAIRKKIKIPENKITDEKISAN